MLRSVVILALTAVLMSMEAFADETPIRVGAIDAIIAIPTGIERPPVALLIAGSGPTDRDGNGPDIKPASLKKLSEQLTARGIATLRYDKRGARGWKPEFGKLKDFRFKDFVDDAVVLVDFLRDSGKFSRAVLIGHSEGGLVAILTARRTSIDRLVLLATSARRQGDLLKAQLSKSLPSETFKPIATAIDAIMTGQIVDPPPGLSIPAAMQPSVASAFSEDPIAPLKLIEQPTLIVGGGRDRQVARQDFDALCAASPKADQLWLDNMNHVLVDAANEADDLSAYNQPERPLSPALIDATTSLIVAKHER